MNIIYRITAGKDSGRQIDPYTIIPYELIKMHEANYEVLPIVEGSISTQRAYGRQHGFMPRRETENSKWTTIKEIAVQCLEKNIQNALLSLNESHNQLQATSYPLSSMSMRLYEIKFKQEVFKLNCYTLLRMTKRNGWVTKEEGYLYPRQSKPHQPLTPFEQWRGRDLGIIKSLAQAYAEDRARWLNLQFKEGLRYVTGDSAVS